MEAEAGVSGKGEGEKSRTRHYKTVEYNLSLAQDITEILQEINFDKFIVLDNFHYLSDDVQKQFAIDLRNFQDKDIRFIILGIWRERNRLLQFNGDLQDRVIEVAVEPWEKNDLRKVIDKGSTILNVDLSELADKMITDSFDSVGVLQELLKESCEAADVSETANEKVKITDEHLQNAICRKLEDYSNRHMRAFETFAYQGRKTRDGQVPLFIPYYFLQVLLKSDFNAVIKGLRRDYIHEQIAKIHHRPSDVRYSDMSNFLHSITNYQAVRKIVPPLFDYDQGIRTLKIIDSTLYFFLRNCNREEVLSSITAPSPDLDKKEDEMPPSASA